jgi:hypothetical protein
MDKIVEEGRRFAATADLKVADMSNQAPVGSTLAILERTLKVMSAVQARVHYALKQELQLIAGIIRDYTPEEYMYEPDEGTPSAKYSDYSDVDILPVSDPNAATLSQRVVQYQAVIQLASTAPQIYNMPLLHRQMLEVLGIKHAEKLVPLEEDQKPVDPVTENMNVLVGKPLKAFAYQDHEAHIQVHQAAMQDPLIQQMVGQNPQAQQIMGSMQAHLAEHIGFAYRNKIELALGVSLPSQEDEMPEAMEKQISRLMAEAAPQVLNESKAMVAQQQAQQNAQDPVLQIQMQELQIKQQEVQIKQQELQLKTEKVRSDSAAKAEELAIKKSEIEMKAELESIKMGAKAASEQRESDARQQMEGIRIGSDMAIRERELEQRSNKPPQGE